MQAQSFSTLDEANSSMCKNIFFSFPFFTHNLTIPPTVLSQNRKREREIEYGVFDCYLIDTKCLSINMPEVCVWGVERGREGGLVYYFRITQIANEEE